MTGASTAVALRLATRADIGMLRQLYGDLRAGELAVAPWPDALKQAFLDQQFALQHGHYTAHFPHADYQVIELSAQAIGRLYLDRSCEPWRLIDIGLFRRWRGQGIGSALIGVAQRHASMCNSSLDLHVQLDNHAARALYERLGFRVGAIAGHHQAMHWQPSVS